MCEAYTKKFQLVKKVAVKLEFFSPQIIERDKFSIPRENIQVK